MSSAARRHVAWLLLATLVLALGAGGARAESVVSLSQAGGGLVFTFSSGWATGVEAATILESHGMHGTFYVSSSLLRQGPYYTAYLSADDVTGLVARGHDVESMTVTQPDLTAVDDARLASELADSQAALQSLTGRFVRHVAYPYGAVDDRVASAAAAHYASGRALTQDVAAFQPTVDAYRIPALLVTSATSLETAKSYVDYAVSHDVYVILSLERITDSPGPYDWSPSSLDALAAHARASGVRVATIAEALGGAPPQAIGGPRGTIVFTFDDGSYTHLDAARVLEEHGWRGSFYIVADCARSEANQAMCMTSEQVKTLAQAGHDIGSHTLKHRDLAALKPKELTKELSESQKKLQALTGQPVRHLAYPYGSHTPAVRAETAKYYGAARIFLSSPAVSDLDVLLAQSGTNPMVVPGVGVIEATSLAQAQAYVDYASSRNVTLVLVFHDIVPTPLDEFAWLLSDFRALADYAATKNVDVRTMAQLYGG